jgi:hypothetical protein
MRGDGIERSRPRKDEMEEEIWEREEKRGGEENITRTRLSFSAYSAILLRIYAPYDTHILHSFTNKYMYISGIFGRG